MGLEIELDEKDYLDKKRILAYLRNRAEHSLKTIEGIKKREARSKLMNLEIKRVKDYLIEQVVNLSKEKKWKNEKLLDIVLRITYCYYIVMIEFRNKVWAYEYMTFSRRIGELWDPFCQLCWEYNFSKDIDLITPPSFKEVREMLGEELEIYVKKLKIEDKEKKELLEYYQKVWNLVTSGEINMKLDLHFRKENIDYMVDFKSGFSSNEKGNTNRLLLVASIYHSLGKKYKCYIFVRSPEDESNHYLKTLKKSGLWNVFCADEAYDKIKDFTGFNIKKWIKENIAWKEDFDNETMNYFEKNNLDIYLKW